MRVCYILTCATCKRFQKGGLFTHLRSETGERRICYMYAIVNVGGKQVKVEQGKWFKTERMSAEVGSKVELPVALLVDDAGNVKADAASLANVKVVCEVLAHGKDDKIVVFKYKAKKNERKKQGHRQPYTKLNVVSIG